MEKWCPLYVFGPKVSPETARKIIFETEYSLIPTGNDHWWEKEISQALVGKAVSAYSLHYDVRNKFAELLGIKGNVSYLHNDRVCSSYIGGRHGWCDWDGSIGTPSSPWNIGKWPSREAVLEDWTYLANRFPELEIDCWVGLGESDEQAEVLDSRFRVKNGKAEVVKDLDYDLFRNKLERNSYEGNCGPQAASQRFFADMIPVATWIEHVEAISGKSIQEIRNVLTSLPKLTYEEDFKK